MSAPPNTVTMTIAQITNTATALSTTPTVTNAGLPFGDTALDPAVTISGTVVGFGDFSTLTLAYFGLDGSTGLWSTGADWAATVTETGDYTASIAIGSDQFAAVVMTTAYWTNFLATNTANAGVITTTTPPSPQSDPQLVLFSATALPGDGRSVCFVVSPAPELPNPNTQNTVAPGEIYSSGASGVPIKLSVNWPDSNTSYTVANEPVSPTDPAFIYGLLNFMPYGDAGPRLNAYPTGNCLSVATIQGVSPDPTGTGGYMCVMLYQDAYSGLYLLVAIAGPNGQYTTGAITLWSPNQSDQVTIELTGMVNIFADKVALNVVAASEQVTEYNLNSFIRAMAKTAKLTAKLFFALS